MRMILQKSNHPLDSELLFDQKEHWQSDIH